MKNFGEWIIEVLEWFTQSIRSFPSRYYTDYHNFNEENDDTETTNKSGDKETINPGGI